MSNTNTKCPDCNCPKCPEPQKCPDQITMEDIIKAVMPGKSPFYTIGEFHMNGKNVDSELSTDATDRWEGRYMFHLQPEPYNPSSQGIMPYSGEISDARPIKLDTVEDMFNLESSIDARIDEELVKQIRYPGRTRNNGMAQRGNNANGNTRINALFKK
jgi:hypothetical protein